MKKERDLRFIPRIKLKIREGILIKDEPKTLENPKIELSQKDKEKELKLPYTLTSLLAEEIGIHLGDGFLSEEKNDFRVKGHRIDEKDYYDTFLKKLYKELFNLDLNMKDYGDSYGFELYSQAISNFKKKVIKIKPGVKDKITIPKIIKQSNGEITSAFLRGLFDTDGNIKFYSK